MANEPKRFLGQLPSIPQGFILGRRSAGEGPLELIRAPTVATGGQVKTDQDPTASAGKWSTARTLSWTGDATGSMSVDGSANVLAALTIPNNTVTNAKLNTLTGSTGLVAQTGANAYAARTLTAPAAGITVTNGNGVSGNPTLALADDLAALEALSGTNTIYYRSGASTWSAVTIGSNLTFSGGTLSASGGGGGGGSFGFLTLDVKDADAGNTTTTETDIFTYTLAAGQLAADKDRVTANYAGVFVSSGTATRQLKIYFGGTAIFDTGALTISLAAAWDVYVEITRVSSTVIRYAISLTTEGAALAAYTAAGELTGLTLSNTNILKVTGTAAGAGAATNDIVGKVASVEFHPFAQGSSNLVVKDEGTTLTSAASSMNFVGAGVTATTSGNDVTVTIPGGGSSGGLTKIAQVTTAALQTTVSFAAIPATYTDLMLTAQAKSNSGSIDIIRMRFNGDTGANYDKSRDNRLGNATATSATSFEAIEVPSSAGGYTSVAKLMFPNYAGATFYKGFTGHHFISDGSILLNEHSGGLWKNTAALSQIDLFMNSGAAFSNGCVFTLYGLG